MEISTTWSWIDDHFYSACVFVTLVRHYYPPRLLGRLCCSGKTEEVISQKSDSQLCLRSGEQGLPRETVCKAKELRKGDRS